MSTTVTNRPDGDRRKRRKGIIGLTAMAVAGALVVGLGYAYFSDSIDFSGSATAGTLDIDSSDLTVSQNGEPVADGSIDNFDPGDVLTITGTVTNSGNKSAWVREVVTVKAGGDLAPYLYVYTDAAPPASPPDQSTLLDTAQGQLVEDTGGTQVGTQSEDAVTQEVDSKASILNGSGTDPETENGGLGEYDVAVTIYFAKEAPNTAQGETLTVDLDVQATQYRNNTDPDTDTTQGQWSTVESGSLKNGVWTAAS